MSQTKTANDELPLSRYRGHWQGFLSTCSYGVGGWSSDRQRRRYEGDSRLLQRLGELVGVDGCFGDLDEVRAREIVEDVEEELFDRRWRLTGDESQPILDRLDAHFAGPRAAWVEQRREREERDAILARERDEQALNQRRVDITVARQAIKDLEDGIAAMERELAEEAKRQGVPAWP